MLLQKNKKTNFQFSHNGCIHFLIVRVRLTYCTKYSWRWTFLFFFFGCRMIAGPGSTIRMWFHGSTPVVWWHACRRQACSAERSLLPSSLCQPGTICQHRNDTQEARPSLPTEAKRKTLLNVIPYFPKLFEKDQMHGGQNLITIFKSCLLIYSRECSLMNVYFIVYCGYLF